MYMDRKKQKNSPLCASSSCITRLRGATPSLLSHNVLSRAENKARVSTVSLFQPQRSSRERFQVLLPYHPLTKFIENPFIIHSAC